ncbi:MAG: hypothetical protein JWO79_4038 [Actinomycetia bacterium]|jgi:hypothetical protein|nr:hypothetical protein [Actinomycetes bacterium]MDQ1659276.1 hypothetical protein [Cryptosporangiaceae bacterium]
MTKRGVVVVLALGVAIVAGPPLAAEAASPPHYANCTVVHTHYKGGIAKAGAKDKRPGGGHARYAPYVNTALYNANSSMDRDHDGIACEQ